MMKTICTVRIIHLKTVFVFLDLFVYLDDNLALVIFVLALIDFMKMISN